MQLGISTMHSPGAHWSIPGFGTKQDHGKAISPVNPWRGKTSKISNSLTSKRGLLLNGVFLPTGPVWPKLTIRHIVPTGPVRLRTEPQVATTPMTIPKQLPPPVTPVLTLSFQGATGTSPDRKPDFFIFWK